MSVEGRVSIDVSRGETPVVRVSYTQPWDVARVLQGKSPAEAQTIIPALFSLCGKAQSHAARLALDAAAGYTAAPATLAGLQCLTEMESLRENCLRISLDWLRALGEHADPAGLKSLMRLVPDLEAVVKLGYLAGQPDRGFEFDRRAALAVISRAELLLDNLVYGEPVSRWRLRSDAEDVLAWATYRKSAAARLLYQIQCRGLGHAGAIDVHALTPLATDVVRNWLAEAVEEPLPSLRGQDGVPETTLLSRHTSDRRLRSPDGGETSRRGLWSRLTARLIELSELPERMRDLVEGRLEPVAGRSLGEGSGMSEVTAARGTLIHAATLTDGRIARYRVLAPTRWNFDGEGPAARAVGRIAATHEAEVQELSELMVAAIDPCVAFNVRIH